MDEDKINSKKGPSKKVHYLEEYRSLLDWRMHPLTERFLEKLSSDIVQWAHTNKDAIRIEDFLSLKGIPVMTYYRWVKKYPILAEAHEEASQRIACNRERLGLEGKLNPGFIERTMPIYCQQYREFLQWKIKQTADHSNDTTRPITIIMEPLVPEKKIIHEASNHE